MFRAEARKKPTKPFGPAAKTQISQGIHPVWSVLTVHMKKLLSKDSDQTEGMYSTGSSESSVSTHHSVCFAVPQHINFIHLQQKPHTSSLARTDVGVWRKKVGYPEETTNLGQAATILPHVDTRNQMQATVSTSKGLIPMLKGNPTLKHIVLWSKELYKQLILIIKIGGELRKLWTTK